MAGFAWLRDGLVCAAAAPTPVTVNLRRQAICSRVPVCVFQSAPWVKKGSVVIWSGTLLWFVIEPSSGNGTKL